MVGEEKENDRTTKKNKFKQLAVYCDDTGINSRYNIKSVHT